MTAPSNAPNKLAKTLGPLDAHNQEAFVLTVRDVARALIFLSVGVVLGVLASWINGMNGRKKA